jgi:hypothetical protein
MSVPLSQEALALLDFLCRAQAKGVRITKLKTAAMNMRLGQLQDAGLVNWHTFEPTSWALHDWHKEQIRPDGEHAVPAEPVAAEVPNESPPATEFFRCGHPRTPENIIPHKNRCRECQKKFAREYMATRRQEQRAKRPVPPPPARTRCAGCNQLTPIRGSCCHDCRTAFDAIARLARYFRDGNKRLRKPESVARREIGETSFLSSTSGAQLADQLVAWCAKTGAAETRLAIYLFKSNRGIAALRESKRVTKATEEKVALFLLNPCQPDELPERLPQNIEAEAALLGALMIDNRLVERITYKLGRSTSSSRCTAASSPRSSASRPEPTPIR